MNRGIKFDIPEIDRSAAEQILSALDSASEITTHGDRITIRARFDDSTVKALRSFANRYFSDSRAASFLIILIRTRCSEMQDKWDMYDPVSSEGEILDDDSLKLCKEILADAALG